MTETEWNSCTDPDAMLSLLKSSGRATERKLRLHLAAICRLLRQRIMDERSREAVRLAEEYADGLIDQQRLTEASQRAHHVLVENTLRRAPASTLQAVWLACVTAGPPTELYPTRVPMDRGLRVALIREIFGLQSRIDRAFLTNTVVGLAKASYEERDSLTGFLDAERLAVLADALEESGCTDATLLGHLRKPGPHIRGCFGIDAILNRA